MARPRATGAALALALAAAGGAACTDFRSPADLRYAQILAVRLEPPHLRAGERARIDVLVSDAAGALAERPPGEVGFAPDPAGRPPALPPEAAGLIVRDGDAVFARAPDEAALEGIATALGLAPGAALLVPLRIAIDVGGESRRADKVVTVLRSRDVPAVPNPAIQELKLDGAPIDPDAGVVTSVGEHELAVAAEGAAGPVAHSWYSAVGEIERYRSATARLSAKEPGSGALLVVVRNEHGGVAWRAVTLTVR
jgi:hypothetical protein